MAALVCYRHRLPGDGRHPPGPALPCGWSAPLWLRVLRQGIAQVLDMQPDIDVVTQAEKGEEAVHLLAAHHPDIVLMDINTPAMDRVTAAPRITANFPETRVIILTMYCEKCN